MLDVQVYIYNDDTFEDLFDDLLNKKIRLLECRQILHLIEAISSLKTKYYTMLGQKIAGKYSKIHYLLEGL